MSDISEQVSNSMALELSRHQARHSAEFDPVGRTVSELCEIFKRLREEKPVFYWQPMNAWVVTRYDDVASVYKRSDEFRSDALYDDVNPEAIVLLRDPGLPAPWSTPQIASISDPDHHRLRDAVASWFMPRAMKRQEAAVRRLVRELTSELASARQADFVRQFADLVPLRVILSLLNFPVNNYQQIREWSWAFCRLVSQPMSSADQRDCARKVIEFQHFVRELIQNRIASPQDDLFSELIQARERADVVISDAEIILMAFTMIFAGQDTTSASAASMFRHLLEDRSRWQAVQADRSSIPDVVEEALRFDGVLQMARRIAPEPAEIGGVVVQGTVYPSVFSANHDEAKFSDPEHFDPARTSAAKIPHLAFGFGSHYCLGAPLARIELRAMLEDALDHMPGLRLTEGQKLVYAPNIVMRQLEQLPVEW